MNDAASTRRRWYVDTSTVAGMLHVHANTIRAHLIPEEEWKKAFVSGGAERERVKKKIPCTELGGRFLVPRWWVDWMQKNGTVGPVGL